MVRRRNMNVNTTDVWLYKHLLDKFVFIKTFPQCSGTRTHWRETSYFPSHNFASVEDVHFHGAFNFYAPTKKVVIV